MRCELGRIHLPLTALPMACGGVFEPRRSPFLPEKGRSARLLKESSRE